VVATILRDCRKRLNLADFHPQKSSCQEFPEA
jgi:hypothetical protein